MEAPAAARPEPLLPLLLLLVLAASVPALALAPWTLSAAGLALAAIVGVSLMRPVALIYFVLLTSALAGLLRTADVAAIGGVPMTLSGARWAMVAVLIVVLLVVHRHLLRLPPAYLPLLGLTLWMGARMATVGHASGLKDILFYALPPLIGVFCLSFLAPRGRPEIERLRRVFIWTVFIPVALYAVTLPLGLVELTPSGPLGIVGPRPLAAFLLVAMCVCLPAWRYADSVQQRRLAALAALLAAATILFTVSRMASVLAVGLLLTFGVNPTRLWTLAWRGLVTAAAIVAVLLSVAPLRERVFSQEPLSIAEIPEQINLSGRRLYWGVTVEHASERPLVGWGPGSARSLVAGSHDWPNRTPPSEYFPHNEYLQIFHDGGLIGLGLCVVGWLILFRRYWRRWREDERLGWRLGAGWSQAAVLAISVVTLSALVDNTFHYSHVMGPVFMILACADLVRESDGGRRPAAAA